MFQSSKKNGADDEEAPRPSKKNTTYGSIMEEEADTDEDDDEDGSTPFRLAHQMSPYISFTDPSPAYRSSTTLPPNAGLFLSVRHIYNQSIGETARKAFQFGGMQCSVRDMGVTATIPNEVLNLVKNLVGAGALALPSGVASFADAPTVLFPTAVWLLVMAAIFAYYFLLIGRTCKITGTATYAEAWQRTYGEVGSGMVAFVIALKAGMGNLECSMILADSFRDLFATLQLNVTRSVALLLITLFSLLPLCLLKNLAVLAPFSMVGLLAMLFTAVAMAIRYMDGSYGENGKFLPDLAEENQPSFGTTGAIAALHPKIMVLLCMVAEAYIAHYNAPRFWIELKGRTVPRFQKVLVSSFGISAIYYIFVVAFGFLTFGKNSRGMMLDNYSTQDVLASMSRACVGFSLIFTYPIIFVGFRDAMLDLLMIPRELHTSTNLNLLSLLLLFIITTLALALQDLGVVTAVGGGTLGTVVVFIIPTLMFCRAVSMLGDKASPSLKQETVCAHILMWVGTAIGVTGVVLALQ